MTPFYALYVTRDRKAAESLRELGFEVFAPTYQRLTRRSRFKALEPAPLLPGYVFARLAESDFANALAVEHVVCVLSSCGKPQAVPEEPIADLMRLVDSGRMDDLLPAKRSRSRGVRLRGLSSLSAWFERIVPEMREAA